MKKWLLVVFLLLACGAALAEGGFDEGLFLSRDAYSIGEAEDLLCIQPRGLDASAELVPDVLVIYPGEADERALFRLWAAGDAEEITFAVDGVRYRFTPSHPEEGVSLIKIGKDSLPFLEALEKAKEPVPVRLAGGSSPKDIRLSEDALEAVRDMYRLFVLAGGAEEDMLALVDATPLEIY